MPIQLKTLISLIITGSVTSLIGSISFSKGLIWVIGLGILSCLITWFLADWGVGLVVNCLSKRLSDKILDKFIDFKFNGNEDELFPTIIIELKNTSIINFKLKNPKIRLYYDPTPYKLELSESLLICEEGKLPFIVIPEVLKRNTTKEYTINCESINTSKLIGNDIIGIEKFPFFYFVLTLEFENFFEIPVNKKIPQNNLVIDPGIKQLINKFWNKKIQPLNIILINSTDPDNLSFNNSNVKIKNVSGELLNNVNISLTNIFNKEKIIIMKNGLILDETENLLNRPHFKDGVYSVNLKFNYKKYEYAMIFMSKINQDDVNVYDFKKWIRINNRWRKINSEDLIEYIL